MDLLINIAVAMAGLIFGFVLRLLWAKIFERAARNDAAFIIGEAEREAERLLKEAELSARDEALQKKEVFENEIASIRKELRSVESRLVRREEILNERTIQLEKREDQLNHQKEQLENKDIELKEQHTKLENLYNEEKRTLHRISGLTREQATEMLLTKVEKQLEDEKVHLIEKYMSKARAEASKKARDILAMAVQRCAVDYTADNVVSTIDIPNDEMKGRIIGREGRNIRAFEKATGIDVIVDDTPGVVVVSGFNTIRREIARRSMEKLILDGRIHPARIEEVVESVKEEMEEIIAEAGKQASYETNVHNLHPMEIQLIGRMKFQNVTGQNLLQHVIEVVHICSLIAGELNLDVQLCKRCALLHDIGRVADEHHEGNHAQVGADIAKRCKETDEVVNAIAAHHERVPARSLYAVVLQIAHTISLDRPGARRPYLDKHLKRLQRLEDLAISFEHVTSAFVTQSGREIRCIVDSENLDDKKSIILSRDIARKIEEEIAYPGEIKITVVRESRIIEYAK